jgi:hypothetical protein
MLTEAEIERYAWLAEEASEVIHAVTKILRHGPDNLYDLKTNREYLALELSSFILAFGLVMSNNDVSSKVLVKGFNDLDIAKINSNLHHNTVDMETLDKFFSSLDDENG